MIYIVFISANTPLKQYGAKIQNSRSLGGSKKRGISGVEILKNFTSNGQVLAVLYMRILLSHVLTTYREQQPGGSQRPPCGQPCTIMNRWISLPCPSGRGKVKLLCRMVVPKLITTIVKFNSSIASSCLKSNQFKLKWGSECGVRGVRLKNYP